MLRIPTAVLAALVASALLAAGAVGGPLKGPKLPNGWSHAEINITVRGVPHTKIYDRGVVTAVRRGAISLREADGSIVTMDVARKAKITVRGRKARLAQVRVGYTVTTLRIDGGPAIAITAIPPKKARGPKPAPQKPEKPKPEKPERSSSRGNGPGR